MVEVSLSRVVLLVSALLAGTVDGSATSGQVGTGPTVDLSFAVVPIDLGTADEHVFVAWRDPGATVHAGVLNVASGVFDAFPAQQSAPFVTNLSVGVGGSDHQRRAYVAWVDSQLRLTLLAYDGEGNVVSPPQQVGTAVQVVPLHFASLQTGALITHAWDDNPQWDPRLLEIDLSGAPVTLDIAENVSDGQTLGVSTSVATTGDARGVVYTVSGAGINAGTGRLQRYDEVGPIGVPEAITGDVQGAYHPFSASFDRNGDSPFALFGIPHNGLLLSSDLRFAIAPFGHGDTTLGPTLSEISSDFPGSVSDMIGLVGNRIGPSSSGKRWSGKIPVNAASPRRSGSSSSLK